MRVYPILPDSISIISTTDIKVDMDRMVFTCANITKNECCYYMTSTEEGLRAFLHHSKETIFDCLLFKQEYNQHLSRIHEIGIFQHRLAGFKYDLA